MDHGDERDCLERVHNHTLNTLEHPSPVLPDLSVLKTSRSQLLQQLPEKGLGIGQTTEHLLKDIAPALNASSHSPNYYGFVTGGITPAARIAEGLVSLYDQNPQVHLPDQTIASNVEDRALRLLMELFDFDPSAYTGVFTTGATASNVVGLACGREQIINQRLKNRLGQGSKETLGSLGLLRACTLAGVEKMNIYTTAAHSSLYKASSVLGIGRSCVKDLRDWKHGIAFNFSLLEEELAAAPNTSVSIVVISCAEINSGLFATSGFKDLQRLRYICDNHGVWLHVDAAFGLFARVLQGLPEFKTVAEGGAGLELADSIAGDAHKLLNVPYDCGFVFCQNPNIAQQVFQNPNAAYLSAKGTTPDMIQSSLNIGIENSRRFRGLPVYSTLISYGKHGYTDMLKRQIRFARLVAAYIFHHEAFDLLPQETFKDRTTINEHIFIIVLFRAKDHDLNKILVERINASSQIYVSGTIWEGHAACRIAASNWQVHPDRDILLVKNVLEKTVKCLLKRDERS